jgi:hypothetical protein
MANIIVDAAKGLEIAAVDLLNFTKKVNAGGPSALAAAGVLFGAVDKALADGAAAAANPTTLVLNLGTDVADIKAVWPAAKQLIATLGIKL